MICSNIQTFVSDSYEDYTHTDRIIYLKGNRDYKMLSTPQDTKGDSDISADGFHVSGFMYAFEYQQLYVNNLGHVNTIVLVIFKKISNCLFLQHILSGCFSSSMNNVLFEVNRVLPTRCQ